MKCECGTEMYPDSYDHPRRPVEWFMRCPNCGYRGPSVATFEETLRTMSDKADDEKVEA